LLPNVEIVFYKKIFSNKSVIETLHKNHLTYCQLKNITPEKDTKLAIHNIIKSAGMNEKRARHCDIIDFLHLLKLFNDANYHFK